MIPRHRAASRRGSAVPRGSAVGVAVCNNAVFVRVAVILSEIPVAVGNGLVLVAPALNCGPQRVRMQMPAVALVPAHLQSLIERDISAGVLKGKRIGPVVYHDVLILAFVDHGDFVTVHKERGQGVLCAAGHNVGIGQFRKGDHDRRHTHIVQKDSISPAADCLNR